MPILLFTSRYDGQLTAPALLAAWVVTGVFSCVLFWRVRVLVRGDSVLGRSEAVSYGALVAATMGGSVLVYLAATPFVYNEDFAWSVALTVGSLFALLGVVERPSWRRVVAAGVLVLCTNLDRPRPATPGLRCLLVAGWFFLGLGRTGNRRWVLPMVVVRSGATGGSCAVTWASSVFRSACPWPTRSGLTSTPTGATSWPPTGVRPSASGSCPARLCLPAARRPASQFGVPLHHPADRPGAGAGRRGDGPDLPDGKHDGDHAPALPAQPVGAGRRLPPAPVRRHTAHPPPGGGAAGRWPRGVSSGASSPNATWATSSRSSWWPARWVWLDLRLERCGRPSAGGGVGGRGRVALFSVVANVGLAATRPAVDDLATEQVRDVPAAGDPGALAESRCGRVTPCPTGPRRASCSSPTTVRHSTSRTGGASRMFPGSSSSTSPGFRWNRARVSTTPSILLRRARSPRSSGRARGDRRTQRPGDRAGRGGAGPVPGGEPWCALTRYPSADRGGPLVARCPTSCTSSMS